MTLEFNPEPGFRCFVFDGKTRATGVHKLLGKVFYRNHNSHPKGGKGLRRSQERGMRIDRELTSWVKWKKFPKRPHVFTKKVKAAFQLWGWVPVEAQGAVGIKKCRVATAFDMTVMDAEGKLGMVELKSHQGNDLNEGKFTFKSPLQDVKDTPHNRALLQVATTARYYHSWRGKAIDFTYTVEVNEHGISRHEPSAFIPRAMEHLELVLASRIKKKK